MTTKIGDLLERLERIEDKFRINSLENEKRFANLEINIESEKFKEISSEIQTLRGLIEKNNSEIQALGEMKGKAPDLSSLTKELTRKVNSEIQTLRELTGKTQSEFNSLRHEMDELERRTKPVDTKRIENEIKSLRDSLIENQKNLEARVKKINSLSKNIRDSWKAIEKTRSEFDVLFDALTHKIDGLERRTKPVDTKRIENEIQTLRELTRKNNSEIQALGEMTSKTQSEFNFLKGQMEKLMSGVKKTQPDVMPEKLKKIDAEIISLRELFDELNKSVSKKEFFDKDINVIKGKVQRLSSLEDEIKKLREEFGMIKSYQMKATPIQLFEKISDKVNSLEKKIEAPKEEPIISKRISTLEKKLEEKLKQQPIVLE